MKLVYDVETNGLLDELHTVHCLVLRNPDTDEVFRYRGLEIIAGLSMLDQAEEQIAHNGIGYDVPALGKVYGWKPGRQFDTLVACRILWPEIGDTDKATKSYTIPPKLRGRHSLEAWGYRLNHHKGDYSKECKALGIDPWAAWSQQMEDYCVQDTALTADLYRRCRKKGLTSICEELEHAVASIVALQVRYGFGFDEAAAGSLYATLAARRSVVEESLREAFGAWWVGGAVKTPKRRGTLTWHGEDGLILKAKVEVDAQWTPISYVEFNPSSRQHIGDRLKKLYGWRPDAFTKEGQPKIDETILAGLSYAHCDTLTEYLTLEKRIGMLSEGREAWLKASKHGRIYGSVNTNGAVTRRMSHAYPNIPQVPKVGSYLGAECRELFVASLGKVLVGADASGIELRCLGHFMARWDGGAYATAVVEGREEDGTDVHSLNAKALGLDPQKTYQVGGKTSKGRNTAKTFIYAYLYGAGARKLAKILGCSAAEAKKRMEQFINAFPALKQLKKAIALAAAKGWILGLDGQPLTIRSPHAALNTLLQSAGALVMKRALVILFNELTLKGWTHGVEYGFCANVHDEWQIECLPELADQIGVLAVQSIKRSGEYWNFRCPLDGAFKIGNSWRDTH